MAAPSALVFEKRWMLSGGHLKAPVHIPSMIQSHDSVWWPLSSQSQDSSDFCCAEAFCKKPMSHTDVLETLHNSLEKARDDWWHSVRAAELTEQDRALAELMGTDSDLSGRGGQEFESQFEFGGLS